MAGGIFCIISKEIKRRKILCARYINNGEWQGVEGYGSATGVCGTFHLEMTSLLATFHNTLINGDTASTILTGSQRWNIFQQDGTYVDEIGLWSDEDVLSMVHIGQNTWRCEYPNGTILTLSANSSTGGTATQEGTVDVYGYTFKYVVHMKLIKLR